MSKCNSIVTNNFFYFSYIIVRVPCVLPVIFFLAFFTPIYIYCVCNALREIYLQSYSTVKSFTKCGMEVRMFSKTIFFAFLVSYAFISQPRSIFAQFIKQFLGIFLKHLEDVSTV